LHNKCIIIHHGKPNRAIANHPSPYFFKKVSSQEELLSLLEEKGLAYTQATLSRDLKFLKVNKISDNEKGYIYELPDQHSSPGHEMAESYAAQGFVSIKLRINWA